MLWLKKYVNEVVIWFVVLWQFLSFPWLFSDAIPNLFLYLNFFIRTWHFHDTLRPFLIFLILVQKLSIFPLFSTDIKPRRRCLFLLVLLKFEIRIGIGICIGEHRHAFRAFTPRSDQRIIQTLVISEFVSLYFWALRKRPVFGVRFKVFLS